MRSTVLVLLFTSLVTSLALPAFGTEYAPNDEYSPNELRDESEETPQAQASLGNAYPDFAAIELRPRRFGGETQVSKQAAPAVVATSAPGGQLGGAVFVLGASTAIVVIAIILLVVLF